MIPLKKDLKLVRTLQQKKFRKEHGLFIVEGKKMVEEAIGSSFSLHSLYTTDNAFRTQKAILVNSKEMDMMSALHTPSDYLAVLHQKEDSLGKIEKPNSTVLLLDGIADPGNMGTILRSAEWFGIHTIFCTEDSVDLYNPKTVQSTMGSLFRVQVIYSTPKEIAVYLKENGYRLTGADMQGAPLYDFDFKQKDAIVIGSESHGIRPDMRSAIDSFITIPAGGKAESLNASVAASIILSEVFRKKQL